MFKLGQRVVIVSDLFEQNIPIGTYGYIIAYDRNADNAFDYVVRIPKVNKNFFLPASDLQSEEELVKAEVDRVEREALIDYALATYNEALFKRIMNGDEDVPVDEENNAEAKTPQDFIRQVNLKAWI